MSTPTVQAEKAYDIPTVSFRVITDDKSLLSPAGVHSVRWLWGGGHISCDTADVSTHRNKLGHMDVGSLFLVRPS